ncbi:MAG TPA: hypothetical protein VEJ47_16905 [Candidatus Eremiobacteraceae bacterium]|nr:hypothetical protein [Candidatus Eremiobacteraceae bacterium]
MAKKKKSKKSGAAKAVKSGAKKSNARAKTKKKAGKAKPPAKRRVRGQSAPGEIVASYQPRGLGTASGGQAGDTQGLSAEVEELQEEGQSFEAELVSGVENAPEPDQGEIRTREVSEEDVPEEDRQPDEYRPKD